MKLWIFIGLLSIFLVGCSLFQTEQIETLFASPSSLQVGLVSYWAFESDGTDSHGNYSLGVVGSPSFVTGIYGNAAEGDGSNTEYFNSTLFATDILDGASAYTFCIWIKSDESNSDNSLILGDTPTGADQTSFQLRYDEDGAGNGTIRHSNDMNSGSVIDIESTDGVQSLDWQHICVAWDNSDGGLVEMYIDGVNNSLSVSDTDTNTVQGSVSDFFQIGRGSKDSNSFNGAYDEAAYWDRRLTSVEISEIYNNPGYAYISGGSPPSAGVVVDNLIVNLTFDNITDWKYDSTGLREWTNLSVARNFTPAKYKGGVKLDGTSGADYLSSSFNLNYTTTQLSFSFWVNITNDPSSETQGYVRIGDNSASQGIYCSEGQYGMNCHFFGPSCESSGTPGSGDKSNEGQWEHYFVNYNGTSFQVYKNADLIKDETDNCGLLNFTDTWDIYIGRGQSSDDINGDMDEFLMWNESKDQSFVTTIYNSKALGPEPNIDLYVDAINYNFTFNYSATWNPLVIKNHEETIVTVKNAGSNASGAFNVSLHNRTQELNKTTVASLGAGQSVSISFNQTIPYGVYDWYVFVDSDQDVSELSYYSTALEDNKYIFEVPYVNRPYQWLNRTEIASAVSYSSGQTGTAAKNAITQYLTFLSDDFTGFSADEVDPRGRKGLENALGCAYNNYNMSKTQCIRAINHLDGWSALDFSSVNAQSAHGLNDVGKIFDIMFPVLTEQQVSNYTEKFCTINQQIANHPSFVINQQDPNTIISDNGKGFGHLQPFARSFNGLCPGNPTMKQNITTDYNSPSIITSWEVRKNGLLAGYKNDSYAFYQEHGPLYLFYSSIRPLEDLITDRKYSLDNWTTRQEEVCAIGRSVLRLALDVNDNGNTLRGDESRALKLISAGDSNSYEDPGSDTLWGPSMLTGFSTLCKDTTVASALFTLRQVLYDNAEATAESRNYPDVLFEWEASQLGLNNNTYLSGGLEFDNANDVIYIRDAFTYTNDTVWSLDGGEDRCTGHCQAQGQIFYYAGDAFCDYVQVPYEDDVRGSPWQCGVSLGDVITDNEGINGEFLNSLGDYDSGYSYFGMADAPKPTFPTTQTHAVIGDSMSNAYTDWVGGYATLIGTSQGNIPIYAVSGNNCDQVYNQLTNSVANGTSNLYSTCGVNGAVPANNSFNHERIYTLSQTKGISSVYMTTMPPWDRLNDDYSEPIGSNISVIFLNEIYPTLNPTVIIDNQGKTCGDILDPCNIFNTSVGSQVGGYWWNRVTSNTTVAYWTLDFNDTYYISTVGLDQHTSFYSNWSLFQISMDNQTWVTVFNQSNAVDIDFDINKYARYMRYEAIEFANIANNVYHEHISITGQVIEQGGQDKCTLMQQQNENLIQMGQNNSNLYVADLFTRYADTTGTNITDCGWRSDVSYTNDGVHPNTAGNSIWSNAYADLYIVNTNFYPNFRVVPELYEGNVYDYHSYEDSIFGVRQTIPFFNSSPIKEYYVYLDHKYLVKYLVVDGNNNSDGIYENYIDLHEEYGKTITGGNLTKERTGETSNVDFLLMWSNETWELGGGETGVNACTSKTSCSGSRKIDSNYSRYYHNTSANNAKAIFVTYGYQDGGQVLPTLSGTCGSDKGVATASGTVCFDTDGDGAINHSVVDTNGWALVYEAGKSVVVYGATDVIYSGQDWLNATTAVSIGYNITSLTPANISINSINNNPGLDSPENQVIVINQTDVTLTINQTQLQTGGELYSVNLNGSTAVSDSCTYGGSGVWTILGVDTCVIGSQVNLNGEDVVVSGSGSLIINANIINTGSIKIEDSLGNLIVKCANGCFK